MSFLLFLLIFFLYSSSLHSQYLATPLQIVPLHKSDVDSLRPIFVWTSVEDAKYYGLQVTTDVTFLTPNATSDLDRGFLTDTIHLPERNFLPDTVYFWRVRARTLDTSGLWSPIRYFRTPKNGTIAEFRNSVDVEVFPNPASEVLNIKFKNENSNNINVYIFDNTSTLVYKSCLLDGVIDCRNFFAGVYTLFFIDSKKRILAIEKVVINR